MALKAKVKVGRVTNLSEARYCAGMGVDLLGFPVGEDGLKPEQYKQLIEWVSGPEFVLEAHHSSSLDIRTITDNYPGHYIEINSGQLDWLSNSELNFILALQPGETVPANENIKFIEILNWNGEKISSRVPLLLNTTDVRQALSLNAGIALTGSEEERPGIKDYQLNDILESLELD